MVVKKKGLYLGLLVSLLGVGNVMQVYGLTLGKKNKFTIKNETGYALKFFVDYDENCKTKTYKKKLRSGRTATVRSAGMGNKVSAFVRSNTTGDTNDDVFPANAAHVMSKGCKCIC